jgi:hypothetical protein
LNPYDSCVANKVIKGKQCTVGWYVNDNILSHVDPKVVDEVLATIEQYFPGLSIERGNKLNFLGMEIDFFEKGKLKLGTVDYLKNMIEEFEEIISKYGESLDRQYPHPAAKWLFTIKPDSKPLEESKGDVYCSFVAKLLWVEKQSRPDIEPTVSFLSTQVKLLLKMIGIRLSGSCVGSNRLLTTHI